MRCITPSIVKEVFSSSTRKNTGQDELQEEPVKEEQECRERRLIAGGSTVAFRFAPPPDDPKKSHPTFFSFHLGKKTSRRSRELRMIRVAGRGAPCGRYWNAAPTTKLPTKHGRGAAKHTIRSGGVEV